MRKPVVLHVHRVTKSQTRLSDSTTTKVLHLLTFSITKHFSMHTLLSQLKLKMHIPNLGPWVNCRALEGWVN